MLMRWIALLLLAASGSPSFSAEPAAEAITRELAAMAGSWRPISAANNGYPSSAGDLAGLLWVRDVNGNWKMSRDGEVVVQWAVQKIDPTQTPRTIDIEVMAGAHQGVVYLGIYELDGDRLRICFALPDQPLRPTDFSAAKGSRRALAVFAREKK
jgi:uncharacterized protein (TIGR03067 family)